MMKCFDDFARGTKSPVRTMGGDSDTHSTSTLCVTHGATVLLKAEARRVAAPSCVYGASVVTQMWSAFLR